MNSQTHIRLADPDDGERLREIARSAKGHWGYEPAKVRAWADTLDFSPECLRARLVLVAESEGAPVAWASAVDGEIWWLDDLWVEPSGMDRGIGARLFERIAEHARAAGASRLEWEAERNALGFYEKMGGRYLRDAASSSWGPANTVMALELNRLG